MFKSFLEVLSQELGLVLCSFFAKSLRTNGSYVLSFPFDIQIKITEYGVVLLQRLFYTARKTIFPFSKCSEKMVFPKQMHWNVIFLALSGKMILLFPENLIIFFRRKMKDNHSQKNTWKYNIFCIFSKDDISFSDKYDITLL